MNFQENLFGSHTLVQLRRPKICGWSNWSVFVFFTLLMLCSHLHWFVLLQLPVASLRTFLLWQLLLAPFFWRGFFLSLRTEMASSLDTLSMQHLLRLEKCCSNLQIQPPSPWMHAHTPHICSSLQQLLLLEEVPSVQKFQLRRLKVVSQHNWSPSYL